MYVQGHHIAFTPSESDASMGTMHVTGYLRGSRSLSANQLVHITGHSDYQINQITQQKPSHNNDPFNMQLSNNGTVVLQVADATRRESLRDLVAIDSLAHEQSIITDEVCSVMSTKYKVLVLIYLFCYCTVLFCTLMPPLPITSSYQYRGAIKWRFG